MSSIQSEVDCLKNEAGFVRLDDFAVVELTGEDRNKFLHSFCTADIKKLEPGDHTEAFILNGKGKSLCFANVLACADRLLLVFNLASSAPEVIEHLDKYLIREDVELADKSSELAVWFLSGNKTDEKISILKSSELVLSPAEVAGDGWMLVGPKSDSESIEAALVLQQIQSCSEQALLVRRVESVTPWNGVDVTVDNLPQEVDREEKSISFTKGCYLGQETVARLDALGRVNWLLRGFVSPRSEGCQPSPQKDSEGVEPEVGTKLEVDGKAAAKITSVAYCETDQRWIAMGYAKRGFEKPGTLVDGWTVR